jgi:hypothetical protein
MRIYETSNYDLFELIESNRPVKWVKVGHMREKIREKNLTSAYVIIVNSKEAGKERYNTDGTKFPIVDGQHRFLSCQLEGKKLYYMINDDITLDDIPQAASMQDSWNLHDYLHHYSTRGISSYKAFSGYMHKNGFPASTTLVILCGNRGQYVSSKLKSGELEITRDWAFANDFADAVSDLGEFINFNKHARFLEAFVEIFSNDEYDHKRMMTKLEFMAGKMRRCPDKEQHLDQLEKVYNYKSRDKIKLNKEQE